MYYMELPNVTGINYIYQHVHSGDNPVCAFFLCFLLAFSKTFFNQNQIIEQIQGMGWRSDMAAAYLPRW